MEQEEVTLNFGPEDRARVEEVVAELLRLRQENRELLPQTFIGLRSITDWLMKRQNMRVPCESYRLIWVGADGTVQMCYVTFKLGNLHEKRLRDMLFSPVHRQAARDAFHLNCPNCNCGYDKRILAHGPSRKLYS